MLLQISFLHFRNVSLLNTLTQLTVKSDVLSYRVETCTEHQVRTYILADVKGVGYSVASSQATCSVSLLFRHTLYDIGGMAAAPS